jgi:predicted alpha/beta hydrolase family esterase
LHGDHRVDQYDWLWPKRGDWMMQLEETLLSSELPALLVAHSLGCQLVAAWAAHSKHTARVRGALLVAPPDVEREDTPPQLVTWRPIARARLPFRSIAVVSTDDEYCRPERAAEMAAAWGSEMLSLGARGHINGESGLGDWAEGRALLQSLGDASG